MMMKRYSDEEISVTRFLTWKRSIGILIVFCVILCAAFSSWIFENVKAGQYMVKQAAVTGELTVWDTPGWKLQMCGDLTAYDISNQLWFSNTKNGVMLPPDKDRSMPIRFADGGKARISGSIRYSLPTGEKLIELHRKYKNCSTIETELVFPMIQKSIVLAGPTMTSKESAATKRNDLLAIIEDQITNGAYKTVVEKKLVKDIDGTSKVVETLVPLKDPEAPNGIARVEESPAKKYGIVFSSFAINDIIYDANVDEAIAKQYRLEMDIQTAMAAARTAEQERKTAEAAGEAEKTKAEWAERKKAAQVIVQAERDKQEALIKANKELETTRINVLREKEAAIIQAQKELEVATLQKQKAEEIKQATILKAEGDAKALELEAQARKKIMEADNALQAKLDAFVKINEGYANAISKIRLPSVVMSSDGKMNNAANDLIDMLKVKTAHELSLDPKISK